MGLANPTGPTEFYHRGWTRMADSRERRFVIRKFLAVGTVSDPDPRPVASRA
jgi:hypothetical protein